MRPGVFPLPEHCTIGLAADWGTGSDSASRVAEQIHAAAPDVTIHMGDVYYSGTNEEYRDFFLGEDDWPRGRLGSYAMNGNHEMYSGGEGYFDLALPALKQQASYFCLENAHWRVLALDTGYYARTVPFLELLLRGLIRLHRDNRHWLDQVVFDDPTDRRPVILLSHHQWFSAFEAGYGSIVRGLEPYLDRVLLWLWGHEHRFAGYAPFAPSATVKVRARCIGHGGMPVEVSDKPNRDRNLAFYDAREATKLGGDPIGYCGCAILRLDGPELRVEYKDERGDRLLEEAWVQSDDGIAGRIVYGSSLLTLAPARTLDDLVGP